MISNVLSTRASPTGRLRGRFLRAMLNHVEVPGLEGLVVPLQDVAADARAGLRVAVKTRYLPATGLEGTADRPRAAEQLQEPHLLKGKKMPTAPAGRLAGPG